MDEDVTLHERHRKWNGAAFWLLGLCNNFAYVVMLSAAKDIMEKDASHEKKPCRQIIDSRQCQIMSTGSVLLADIVPALVIKITAPLFIHRIPFGMRHLIVVLLQTMSFLIVARSTTTFDALFGVILASLGSGLGEISYLALTSNYPSKVVSFWSSGTGGAGIIGALAYAFLTELGLTPKQAMYLMLVLPIVFSLTYWQLLTIPRSVHRVVLLQPSTYLIPRDVMESEQLLERQEREASSGLIVKLLKFMIPLILVYYAEYYINQGLLELLEFDCAHGFSMSSDSQYRWFQVTYQLGVFVSRSSSDFVKISYKFLPMLAVLQIVNALVFTTATIYYYLPHILIAFLVIFIEGLLGGASYVNTFRAVHKKIEPQYREFSMGVVSISDTIGIVAAGFTAIPVHNVICSLKL